MIRRTFKARAPRNIILNKFYKVWWNLNYTSIIQQNRNILFIKLNKLTKLNLLMDRKNIIFNNIYLSLKPNYQIYDIKGYKPKRLTRLVQKKYEVGTSWQTKQKFINTYTNSKFNNFNYINNYIIINSLIKQNLKLSFSNNKILNDLIKFNTQTNFKVKKKRFLINKKWKQFNMTKQQYSLRERFARILINRNKLNYQHPYFVETVTRSKN